MISVIVPILNEEKVLEKEQAYFERLANAVQLIFVDGGSSDNSIALACKYGEVLNSSKGRARQMNLGAEKAHGKILLFLHVDTCINPDFLEKIQQAILKDKYVGGCFSQKIDRGGLVYRWIAFTGNVRARLTKVFYGDQGIFVRKDIFTQIGQFPEIALCEDIMFTKKLKQAGKTTVLKEPIVCSSRRWDEQGVWQTFILNMRISRCVLFNKNQTELAKLYRDVR